MTGVRAESGENAGELSAERCALPASAGIAAFGDRPAPRPVLVTEDSAGLARVRAEAQRGLLPELSVGGEHACHRKDMVTDRATRVSTDLFAHSARRRARSKCSDGSKAVGVR